MKGKKSDKWENKNCQKNSPKAEGNNCNYLRNTKVWISKNIFDFWKFALVADFFFFAHFSKNLKNSEGDFPTSEKSSRVMQESFFSALTTQAKASGIFSSGRLSP